MKDVRDIPYLRIYRTNVLLPLDSRIQSMYSMVFLNSCSIESSINMIKNKQVYHNSKFHNYYMDVLYHGKVLTNFFNYNIVNERDEIYKKVKTETNVHPQKTFNSINRRNVYIDLYYYNKIFFENIIKETNFFKRLIAYLKFFKSQVKSDTFKEYKNKIVIIDVDSWITNIKESISKNNKFDNVVSYFYFALMKFPDELIRLGDIDILFVSKSNNMILKLNPIKIDNHSFRFFKQELAKMNVSEAKLSEDELDKQIEEDELKQNIKKNIVNKYNFSGQDSDDIIDTVDNDEEVNDIVSDIVKQNIIEKPRELSKRDIDLKEGQKKIKIGKRTIEDIINVSPEKLQLEKNNISTNIKTSNSNMNNVHYPSFEKVYNRELMEKHLLESFLSMNEKSIPVFIRDITVEDSSDELNFKSTYTVNLEDVNRLRHTVKIDIPKFIDDKFLYLNGNKKIIIKQLYKKPVVKNGPDEVELTSSYKKIIIRRYGRKLSPEIEKFKKVIQEPSESITIRKGDNTITNKKYETTLEYDEIAKLISYIKCKGSNAEFYFNVEELRKRAEGYKIKLDYDKICIGFRSKKEPIYLEKSKNIIEMILDESNEEMRSKYNDANGGKKFMYTRAKIMGKSVPVILLIAYQEGLTTVLKKAKINHYFTDKRPTLKSNEEKIQFADGYLVYEKYPFSNSLLLNAMDELPTRAFNYSDFDDKTTYLSIFDSLYNQRNLANAFDNFYEWFIDPIMKESLKKLNLPTSFVEVMIYANSLLEDSSYSKEFDYRVRSNEIVNAILYREIADAYSKYRMTASNNNPVKISLQQDSVIKSLLSLPTVDDYSTLNPIVELEKSRAVTTKGFSGINLDESYTLNRRSYDKSMLGTIAMSTAPDAECGVIRQLTMEPGIVDAMGNIDSKSSDLDKLKDINLFSPAELLSPLGATRDDSIRTAMAVKQSKHIIPVKNTSPVLISNGSEEAIHYHLSDEFSVVAEYDGKVVEKDEETNIMVIEYTTPNKETIYKAVDISNKVVKNGAGGFYLTNKLITNLKVGDKIKKNDIIAWEEKFFSESEINGNRFNIGSLQKVACMGAHTTYEDATFITNKVAKDMTSEIIMNRPVILSKNSNIDYIVKIGDKVDVGDQLLRFEQLSNDDESLSKFLATVGEELKEEIVSLGKSEIKSKYSGEIVDIKIYSTVELDELSPSLRKLVSDYYNKIKKKHKVLDKYDKSKDVYKMGLMINEPIGKYETKNGKVKGYEVGEGVLIDIYIKYINVMGVGDKLAYFTALKSIVSEVIEEGYEPYTLYRPEEEISSFIAPSAILARMTPSILLTMFGNKVLVELKRRLEEIYNE